MLIFEYKLDGTRQQYAAIDEAIRIVQFLGWMKSYAAMHGIEVVAVPPHYTSQDCSGCGERVQKTLSTRTHVCPTCGLVLDRDENAAVNILAKALDGTLGNRGTHERVS